MPFSFSRLKSKGLFKMHLNTLNLFAGSFGNCLVALFFILLKAHANFLTRENGYFVIRAISIPFKELPRVLHWGRTELIPA